MKNITYLFGAGASCSVLPLNDQITERLESFIDNLLKLECNFSTEVDSKLKKLIADLKWLLEHSKNHSSVDTFAKKLYIKQKWKELKRLRLALSVFFHLNKWGKYLINDMTHFLLLL